MTSLKIGTRESPLALAQAHLVRDALIHQHPYLLGHIEIVPMTTTGDAIQDRTLIELGGKSLFTKEIEEALFQGTVDVAVHSLKDMPYALPEGLKISAVLAREDARDAVVNLQGKRLKDLPKGTKVGTSSLRRQSQILYHYPHLEVVPFRGNVGTRLRKLEEGQVGATILALAGLNRLSLPHLATEILPFETMIPGVGQGAIAIEARTEDAHTQSLLKAINHQDTWHCVMAERAFMKGVEGSCRTPLGAYAELHGSEIFMRGCVGSPDGKKVVFHGDKGLYTEAEVLGFRLADMLKRKADVCGISY